MTDLWQDAAPMSDPNARISRRRFGATVAAGGIYTGLHQLLGVMASSAQTPQQPRAPNSVR